MKTTKGNKLIAEFIGWDVYDNGHGVLFFGNRDMFDHSEDGYDCSIEELDKMYTDGELRSWYIHQDNIEFHSSWDWLMPVVEKIKEYVKARDFKYTLLGSKWNNIQLALLQVNREDLYERVIEFI